LLAQLAGVKDTPAGGGPWSLKKCIAVPVHPTFFITRTILIQLNRLLKNSSFVSGHHFSDAASALRQLPL
jgi:hypothetical protein